jgi:galactosamine-6-phosphate isomerase
MKIERCYSYKELSEKAKDIVVQELRIKPNLLLCAATGASPTETYRLLGNEYQKQPGLFSKIQILKLDEWGGIPMNFPTTCENYIQTHLIQTLHIPASRYTGFISNPENPEKECARVQHFLDKSGPIDICVLGLGMNGHLALNEPGEYLQPYCHIARLSEKTLQHQMAIEMKEKPTYGLTLGMADILLSKMILILINGSRKREIAQKLLSKQITTAVPASLLWLHPNVTCLIDNEAIDELNDLY